MVWTEKCRAVVKSVTNLRFSYNAGKFLSTPMTYQLLKRTPLLGFNWLPSYSNHQLRWLVFRLRFGKGTHQKTKLRFQTAHPTTQHSDSKSAHTAEDNVMNPIGVPHNTTFWFQTAHSTILRTFWSQTAHPTIIHSDSKWHTPQYYILIPNGTPNNTTHILITNGAPHNTTFWFQMVHPTILRTFWSQTVHLTILHSDSKWHTPEDNILIKRKFIFQKKTFWFLRAAPHNTTFWFQTEHPRRQHSD
jgi:hypothetical protein